MSPDFNVMKPNFSLLVNQNPMEVDLYIAVTELAVEDELNLPAMFTIKLDTVNFETNDWQALDLIAIKPGDEMIIAIGMDQTEHLMIGEVTSLEAVFGESPHLVIRGYDRMYRLRFGTKRRSFKDMKDSQIAQKIAQEAGLTAKADDTGPIQSYVFQNNQSNYEFLRERAGRLGFEMLAQDHEFFFRRPQEAKAPELTMEYIYDFTDFTARLNVLTAGSQVEVRGWDVKTKQVISGQAAAGSETSIMSGKKSGFEVSRSLGSSGIAVPYGTVVDATEAEAIAKAQYNYLLKEFITGEGSCMGNPKIRAGRTIELTGLGERFSGIYYIVSSAHTLTPEAGYITKFKVKRTGI
ncbi:MAG TPA: contractile injection system protein, VgrG/Pvc8 family [Bacillota bacterium]|nr:contractile injection system protein, VgrG/Pvc8 family [Bacillota bacterium]